MEKRTRWQETFFSKKRKNNYIFSSPDHSTTTPMFVPTQHRGQSENKRSDWEQCMLAVIPRRPWWRKAPFVFRGAAVLSGAACRALQRADPPECSVQLGRGGSSPCSAWLSAGCRRRLSDSVLNFWTVKFTWNESHAKYKETYENYMVN